MEIEIKSKIKFHFWCSQCSGELEIRNNDFLNDGETRSISFGYCLCRKELENKLDDLEDINSKLIQKNNESGEEDVNCG